MLGLVACVGAQTGQVIPSPKFVAYNNSGTPCAGCKLFSYVAGTTTKQDTYTTSALSVANANPVVLDSAGRATIFIDPTKSYKFVLAPSTDTDPPAAAIWTVDSVIGPSSGVLTVTAASTRGVQITRSGADAGLSIASTGGSGKTYGIVSNTSGSLLIRDDSDGTPNITISGNDITSTATGTVITAGNASVTGTLAVTGLVTGSANFTSTNTSPLYTLIETDAAADNKRWAIGASSEGMNMQVVNDAASVGTVFFDVQRTGTTVDSINFSPTEVTNTGRYRSATLQPGFLAYNSVIDTGLGVGVSTVDLDTEVYDNAGNFSADTFTAPVAGQYEFCGTVYFSALAATSASVMVSIGGGLDYQIGNKNAITDSNTVSGCVILSLTAAQSVSLRVNFVGGGPSSINGGNGPVLTFMSGRLLP